MPRWVALFLVAAPIAAGTTHSVHFEPNQGQFDPQVRYLARASGLTVFLTGREALITAGPSSVRMWLVGANPAPRITPLDRQDGVSHYLTGSDPARWTTGVAHYARVRYEQVYPGVDLVHYGNGRRLEYDFVVAPGADYRRIRLRFRGARRVRLDPDGHLLLDTASGVLRQHKPLVYQEPAGRRREIEGGYVIRAGEVAFRVGSYDPSLPLTIDPWVMYYSGYLGGAADDRPSAVATDQQGNTYIAGATNSANFPTASPYQGAGGGRFDVFLTKLDRERGQVVYSTYLGGSDDDEPRRIFVDVLGNVYVAGSTRSANFPITPNAVQRTLRGGADAFVAKLNPAGSQLTYSTYLGGSGMDVLLGFSLDGALNAYVSGLTTSTDFPRSPGSFGATFGGGDQDGFVAKLNVAGSQLVYSGYLGGRAADAATAVAVTSFGEAYVTGWTRSTNFPTAQPLQEALGGGMDAFLVKLLPEGNGLEYASYLGGSRDDVGTSVLADPDDNAEVLVAGFTDSSNFPRAERTVVAELGEFNTFVAGFAIRLAAAATEDLGGLIAGITRDPRPGGGGDPVRARRIVILRRLAKCLRRAGREIEHELVRQSLSRAIGAAVSALARTPAGAALNPLTDKLADWVCPQLAQENSFAPEDESRQSTPSTPGSIEILNLTTLQFEPGPALPGPEGSATPVGVAFDRFGTFHILAETENPGLPVSSTGTAANRGTVETYVMRFSENPPPLPAPTPPTPTPPPANQPRITSALNGASFSTTAPGVTPGSIVTLFGERLAAATAQAAATPLPTTLGGASVSVAGRAAPLFYASPTQVNLQVPYETPAGQAQVVVTVGGVASAAVNPNIVAAAPGVFTFGANRAVVQNQDFSVNTADNPARVGSIITAYLTGGGGFDNAARLQTGVPTPADPLNRVSSLAFSATLGGQGVEVLFLGLTPGLIGVLQANLRVPNLAAGNYPLVVTIGGVASNAPLITVTPSQP
jgi:uncharacterized protein (TIGR03437 family)